MESIWVNTTQSASDDVSLCHHGLIVLLELGGMQGCVVSGCSAEHPAKAVSENLCPALLALCLTSLSCSFHQRTVSHRCLVHTAGFSHPSHIPRAWFFVVVLSRGWRLREQPWSGGSSASSATSRRLLVCRRLLCHCLVVSLSVVFVLASLLAGSTPAQGLLFCRNHTWQWLAYGSYISTRNMA